MLKGPPGQDLSNWHGGKSQGPPGHRNGRGACFHPPGSESAPYGTLTGVFDTSGRVMRCVWPVLFMCRRILTVDDDPETTGALKRLLECHGYVVREENDSMHALAAAQ